jgi:hypothetical protein
MAADWPSIEQVKRADDEQLIRWNIELPKAKTEAQQEVLNAIGTRIRMMTSFQHMTAQQKVTGGG